MNHRITIDVWQFHLLVLSDFFIIVTKFKLFVVSIDGIM